jgi:predicted NBD/HSP70 family sugar kinase
VLAREVLVEVGGKLGMGLANLVNVLNPQMIVLGGALSLAAPFLLPRSSG